MDTDKKIQMLTGARAALIDLDTERFFHFVTLTAKQAASMIRLAGYGITASGELWCISGGYRYVFSDKALAAIAL